MSTDPTLLPNSRARVPEMDQDSAAVWDWGNLLDFTIYDDDPLTLPWDTSEHLLIPSPPPPPQTETVVAEAVDEESPAPAISTAAGSSKVVRVRKRDPRLVCENFLAGRVPCACPELDAMMLEEEEAEVAAGGGRKRVRKGPAASATAAILRCQVPGCEADIRELKGYHRRHRVCLRCANAASVVIDGEDKRYCQQCGK